MSEEAPERPRFSTNDKLSGAFELDALPYTNQKRLLSDGERRFYQQGLLPAIGNRFNINLKTRLTDILGVPAGQWRAAAGRKISQRHVDFVLCSKKALSIVAVIELDDASHLSEGQEEKDNHLDDALFAAGIPILRFPIYKRYDAAKIRAIVNRVLKTHPLRAKRNAT